MEQGAKPSERPAVISQKRDIDKLRVTPRGVKQEVGPKQRRKPQDKPIEKQGKDLFKKLRKVLPSEKHLIIPIASA